MQDNVLLRCENLTKSFGGLTAVHDLSFDIQKGEVLGLIGPNGAGKTTVFNLLTGVLKPDSGQVMFHNQNLVKLPAHKITELGIARTFQLIRAFEGMTVLDNAIIGGLFGRRKSHDAAKDDAMRHLSFVGLDNCADMLVRNLTPYDRKRTELAAALNTEPELILLDEFIAGLNESEINNAIKMTRKIRDEAGKTLFWIEHVMKAIMSVAERIVVIDYGKKIADGPPKEISKDEKVIAAYLGSQFVEESGKSAKSE